MNDRKRTQDSHPGMMGDGTEEQSLGQVGDPSARIGEDEVIEAFRPDGRSFAPKGPEGVARPLRQRAKAVQEWAADKTDGARQWASERAMDAEQVIAERPVVVVTVSTLVALTAGLAIGFLLGREAGERDNVFRPYWS